MSAKETITGIAVADPTGHASTAWAIVSLGLKNDRALQDALFDACDFLTNILARYTVVNGLVPKTHGVTIETIQKHVVALYACILRYAMEMGRVESFTTAERICASISALGSICPMLETFRKIIEDEDKIVKDWIELNKILHDTDQMKEILDRIDKTSNLVHKVNQELRLSSLDRHTVSPAIRIVGSPGDDDECLEGTRIKLMQQVVD
ncbi:hypothetical protein BJY04DRAFT_222579 [Aspergillus karnatakaensis]|uniref:uncharacterized protein n=1 Tax=Aspergillus karnatakaensis TaxID=1810916 RepID=UPI003CCDDF89